MVIWKHYNIDSNGQGAILSGQRMLGERLSGYGYWILISIVNMD